MGLWQLGVYDSKHVDTASSRVQAKPVSLTSVWGPDDPFDDRLLGKPVAVRGTFSGKQFLIQRGRHRRWVVAPLRVAGTHSLLLVVRGWTTASRPSLPTGSVAFRAVLQPGESSTDPSESDGAHGVYSALSIPQLANVVDGDLYSGYAVTADARVTAGLTPVEPASPEVSWTVGLRNLAYALQWWIFGLFAVFMWWRMATDAVAIDAVAEESIETPSVT